MALELNGTTGVSLVQDGVVQTADLADDAVTAAKIGSLPAGSVLQVKNYLISDRFAIGGTSVTTIWTGDDLTLSDTSSKILTIGNFSIGGTYGGSMKLQFSTDGGSNWSNISTHDMQSTDSQLDGLSVMGMHLNLDDAQGQRMSVQTGFNHSHAPSSTSVKYRLQAAASQSSGYNFMINRRQNSDDWGALSWVTQMEIAG